MSLTLAWRFKRLNKEEINERWEHLMHLLINNAFKKKALQMQGYLFSFYPHIVLQITNTCNLFMINIQIWVF